LSRFPIAIPYSQQTAQVALEFVQSHIVALFGIPRQITADRGSAFVSHVFREWCSRLNIQLNLVPAYQPDGMEL
jgi:transposase InsO family protein